MGYGPTPAPCYEKKRRWHKSECKPAGHMLDDEIRASNGAARGRYETGQGCERRKDDPTEGEQRYTTWWPCTELRYRYPLRF